MKVLAIDDEQVALASIRRLLRRRGVHNVDTCESGKEAICRIREQKYDIVLLDLLILFSVQIDTYNPMKSRHACH